MHATTTHPPDAQVPDVAGLLHVQADRLTAQAAHTLQHASAARTTATRLDAQAADLLQRADRLHAQADQLLHAGERAP